jgi:hypothetical protein
MEWKVDTFSSITIDDSVVSKLKEWAHIHKPECKFRVKMCDPMFWLTKEERERLTGPIGNYGDTGVRGPIGYEGPCSKPEPLPTVESKKVVVQIEFTIPTIYAEKICVALKTTLNSIGMEYPTWAIFKMDEGISFPCGIYKKKGFDEAYQALRMLKPNLSEQQFANAVDDCLVSPDEDLVTMEPFHGMNGCIKVLKNTVLIDTGKSNVCLSLLAIDVDANFEYLTTLLANI